MHTVKDSSHLLHIKRSLKEALNLCYRCFIQMHVMGKLLYSNSYSRSLACGNKRGLVSELLAISITYKSCGKLDNCRPCTQTSLKCIPMLLNNSQVLSSCTRLCPIQFKTHDANNLPLPQQPSCHTCCMCRKQNILFTLCHVLDASKMA